MTFDGTLLYENRYSETTPTPGASLTPFTATPRESSAAPSPGAFFPYRIESGRLMDLFNVDGCLPATEIQMDKYLTGFLQQPPILKSHHQRHGQS